MKKNTTKITAHCDLCEDRTILVAIYVRKKQKDTYGFEKVGLYCKKCREYYDTQAKAIP